MHRSDSTINNLLLKGNGFTTLRDGPIRISALLKRGILHLLCNNNSMPCGKQMIPRTKKINNLQAINIKGATKKMKP